MWGRSRLCPFRSASLLFLCDRRQVAATMVVTKCWCVASLGIETNGPWITDSTVISHFIHCKEASAAYVCCEIAF